jgi:hypothetical protein
MYDSWSMRALDLELEIARDSFCGGTVISMYCWLTVRRIAHLHSESAQGRVISMYCWLTVRRIAHLHSESAQGSVVPNSIAPKRPQGVSADEAFGDPPWANRRFAAATIVSGPDMFRSSYTSLIVE